MNKTIYLGETTFIDRTRIVEWLRYYGILPYGTRPDTKDITKNVWLYHTNDALVAALNEYEHHRGHDRQFAKKSVNN